MPILQSLWLQYRFFQPFGDFVESEVSMPDIMLLPKIASVLKIRLEELYDSPKTYGKDVVSADEFPAFVHQKMHELFYQNTHMRFSHIAPSDEAQMEYQSQMLKSGCRLGCISNTQGAMVLTDDYTFKR